MRFLTTSMMALVVAAAITGCSGSSNSADNSSASSDNSSAMSSSSDNSSAMSSSSDNSAASSDNSAAAPAGDSAAKTGDVPAYPGAKTEAAGSNSMSGSGMAAGKVLSTGDSFDKVYAWYQKNMPSGSEKAHTESPVKSAVFTVGEAGKDQQSVTISTANGKTMISIAHVKM